MSPSFAVKMAARSADDYADFLIPRLKPSWNLLDLGCGQGEITMGLSPFVRKVHGIDLVDEFSAAETHMQSTGISNVTFATGDAYRLDLEDETFDVCFSHSTLEALAKPDAALRELFRVLKPGGLIAVASVEYSGLIIHGEDTDLLQRFYQIRQFLWRHVAGADPEMGRSLRARLGKAGFSDVIAATKTFSYGTEILVNDFGKARARECESSWFKTNAIQLGRANDAELTAMATAWLNWSVSSASYLSFAWCRAIATK